MYLLVDGGYIESALGPKDFGMSRGVDARCLGRLANQAQSDCTR